MKYFTTLMLIFIFVSIGYSQTGDYFITGIHLDSTSTVEFQCNMSVQMKKGLFNPATDAVLIRGNMNGWGTGDTLKDANVDSIYTITLTPSTNPASFKFYYNHSGDVWENDPNREYTIPPGASSYYCWFKNDSIYVQQYDIAVTFSCNMELERLSGRFDPATDTVSVNGDFNGWTAKTNIMTPNGFNPDIYEVTTTITRGIGETINFKFWYTENNWESVDNRVYTFTSENASSLTAEFSASFNNGSLDNVINQQCAITFTVNTNGAISRPSGTPFPSIDSVFIAGSALPLQWPAGGWPNGDITKVIRLFDDGTSGDAVSSDGIYSKTLTIPAYTVLNFQYKYGINYAGVNIPGGDGNDNENSFGANHLMAMTRYMSHATTVDTFGTMGTTTLINVLGVTELPQIPTTYLLNQNYPNPFNPATTIEYGIPSESFVTLTVYNMIGQEVATLVNQQQHASTYRVTFDAGTLPTGMYFYKISAGDFVSTKKMMLVK